MACLETLSIPGTETPREESECHEHSENQPCRSAARICRETATRHEQTCQGQAQLGEKVEHLETFHRYNQRR